PSFGKQTSIEPLSAGRCAMTSSLVGAPEMGLGLSAFGGSRRSAPASGGPASIGPTGEGGATGAATTSGGGFGLVARAHLAAKYAAVPAAERAAATAKARWRVRRRAAMSDNRCLVRACG